MILEFKVELPQLLDTTGLIRQLAVASNCCINIEFIPVERGKLVCDQITFSISGEQKDITTFVCEWDRFMRKMGRALKPI